MSDHVLANRHSYTVWLGYASFVTLTLVAILISPAVAANESWIGVVIALACSVPMACIPLGWAWYQGPRQDPVGRLRVMSIGLLFLVNFAISCNRVPDSNNRSLELLQAVCIGLGLILGMQLHNMVGRNPDAVKESS